MRRLLVPGLLLLLAVQGQAADLPDDWAFKPVRRPAIPAVDGIVRSPVDAFLLAQLHTAKLRFTPAADRSTLLRRANFDLTGLPPTATELDAFLADTSPNAFEKVVDRLLASPAYGERQSLPWLDLVRFAETDGFKADDRRPHAWRYRDYVIRAFNADKPFDQFVKEQLAGDELYPDDPDTLVATAFLRHYPDEYNAVNLEQRRQEILNDITDTTAQAFLGITLGCAKCHDHKFDPIPQEDYYRIQAFFAGWKEVEVPIMPAAARCEFERKLHDWEARTADVRRELDEIERPHREKFSQKRRGRFPDEYAKLLDIPRDKRTPYEEQIAYMVSKQVYADDKTMFNGMKPAEKERWEGLKKKLADAGPKPVPPAVAMGFSDVSREAPPTHLLQRGNWRKKGEEIKPGFLSAFDDRFAEIRPPSDGRTTGRRTVLANWITDPKNPLTARVIVNRVWMQHFGQGIVGTPGDFGSQGEKPTHPELLDWLASEFVNGGWSLKKLHRMIMLSDAYQQGSAFNTDAAKVDPDNDLLWRMNRRRLDGESLRDAVLCVAGVLNPKEAGPSVYPELPSEIKTSAGAWPVSADAAERNRRSIYVYVKRNLRYPLFAAFDAPDRNEACSRRFTTTTAPQALMLLNEKLYAERARQFAERVVREVGDDRDAAVERGYQLALARKPTSEERSAAERFLESQTEKAGGAKEAFVDFCHALFNLNEFVYVD
ncbi:MAG TPA: DUF1549 and DUF1553 domain-containing protein [Gemmataceae bacterium]|nr:DUF1549 and DUF1553 domain-containing protein [Gemmataceae bacterium]